jgi:predicted Zn-dependent protease
MKSKIGLAPFFAGLVSILVSCVPMHQPSVNDLVNAAITAVPDILPITEAEEIKIGRSIAANVAGRYGVVRDMELTRYVNLVGNTVARKSGRPNLRYSFAVLDTDIINAFSCPGGYVFISMGSLDIIDSEAELAAVLAHEVAHVAKRHIIKEIEKKKFLNVGGKVVGNYLNADPRIFNMATAHGTELLFKGYSRVDEYQADRLSLSYTSEAGYDPKELLIFLEKIKAKSKPTNDENVRDRRISLLFSTHPDVDNRIERARGVIERRKSDDSKGVLLKERYNENVTPIVTEYFRYYFDYYGGNDTTYR